MKIRLSSPIKEIFEQWPEAIELFLQHRMNCPGCYLAEFDYLENALQVYNISQEEFLDSLEEIIKEGR